MRVRVDPEECVACGLCIDLCPEVFSMEEEVATAADDIPEDVEDGVREAVEYCPVDAIELMD